jgi:hypothetical protein
MKINQFPLFLLSLLLALVLGIIPVQSALAQNENPNPWLEVLGSDGSINFDNLTDLGTVNVEDLGWMNTAGLNLPLLPGMDYQFTASFHRYLTPGGNIVVLPDAPTMFFMMMNPEESGLNQMLAGMGVDPTNGNMLALSGNTYQDLLAGYVDWSQFTGTEFELPGDFFDALTNGDPDSWSWLLNMTPEQALQAFQDGLITGTQMDLLNAMDLERFRDDLDSIMSGSGWSFFVLLLYSPGSMDCDAIPGGCPEDLCLLVPQVCTENFCAIHPELCDGNIASCPAATVTIGSPVLKIYPVDPDSPLVVGQDPEKRGVDIQVEVIIPPTVHSYYVPVPVYEDVQRCIPPDGEVNPLLDCKTNAAVAANNGTLKTVRELVRFDCQHHVDTYPESISGVSASAQLTQASQEWIEQDLSAYYYGAQVLQENFSLIPGLGAANVGCDAGKTCRASALVTRVPFRDPGLFSLGLTVQTAGTPVTSGRVLNGSGQVEVFFISVRLIENGSY